MRERKQLNFFVACSAFLSCGKTKTRKKINLFVNGMKHAYYNSK